jgi:hydrogenase/urease accessory protein HupE
MVRIALAALAAFYSSLQPVGAHPAPFSYLDLHLEPEAIRVTAVVHVFDIAHELGLQPPERFLEPAVLNARRSAIAQLLTDRISVETAGRVISADAWSGFEALPDRQSVRVLGEFRTGPLGGSIGLAALLFPYDPQHQTFLNFYENGQLVSQAILGGDTTSFEHFAGTTQGTLAVVGKFVPSGIHHILIGPDHILFLVGLLLLGGSLKRLLIVVTAFTVAHSITLSLAALNFLNPDPGIVEPAIALSIVYVGVDNLTVRGGRDMRAWIALAFGLVHGFGFASVLREMGLPPRALGWSLFSFNIGVEIGQLMVVIVVAGALAALRTWSEAATRRLAVAGSIMVITAGVFWFVQRVFFSRGVV